MQFRTEQTIAAAPDLVESRLADPAFIAATSRLHPLTDCRLLDRTDGPDGSVRLRIHRRFAADLPRAVTAVVDPARLTWIEDVRFRPGSGHAAHRILPDHYGELLTCAFTTTLAGAPLRSGGAGTRRLATGRLTVRVLLGAGPVERAIVSGLRAYASAEADLLGSWPPPEAP
jgi:hypothetical protein